MYLIDKAKKVKKVKNYKIKKVQTKCFWLFAIIRVSKQLKTFGLNFFNFMIFNFFNFFSLVYEIQSHGIPANSHSLGAGLMDRKCTSHTRSCLETKCLCLIEKCEWLQLCLTQFSNVCTACVNVSTSFFK